MKLFLAALTIWSLPFLGISCGSANVQTAETPRRAESTPAPSTTLPSGETITLTNDHSHDSFGLKPDLLKNPPAVLEITLTKVSNPAARPVNVFVYLSPADEKDDPSPDRITVGNFSLYPADRPARFMLDAERAFRKLAEAKNGPNEKEWRLLFVLQREATEGTAPVEVTIAAPNWKAAKD